MAKKIFIAVETYRNDNITNITELRGSFISRKKAIEKVNIMSDIFNGAKFGDKFKTRDGRIAILYSVCEEDDGYNFIIEPSENSVETVGIDFHFVDKNGHWHRRDDVDTENDIVEKF